MEESGVHRLLPGKKMREDGPFRVNEKEVAAKVIDGEAIIINLANGLYYSLEKTGALAWVLIGGGYSLDESADLLSARFSEPRERVRADLDKLANELLVQKLILVDQQAGSRSKVALDPPTGDAYETPVLNTYDDMGDVLALDPPLPQVEVVEDSWEPAGNDRP
jgi:hypothetical protein